MNNFRIHKYMNNTTFTVSLKNIAIGVSIVILGFIGTQSYQNLTSYTNEARVEELINTSLTPLALKVESNTNGVIRNAESITMINATYLKTIKEINEKMTAISSDVAYLKGRIDNSDIKCSVSKK